MDLEGSLLYRLDPSKADDMYRTVGANYQEVAVNPQIRSAIREVTASYDAKALYSAERDKIARETLDLFSRMSKERGIIRRRCSSGRSGFRRSWPTRSRRS